MPDAPTVLFCHGAGGQADQFYDQLAFYFKRANLVAFDMAGHGSSDKPLRCLHAQKCARS